MALVSVSIVAPFLSSKLLNAKAVAGSLSKKVFLVAEAEKTSAQKFNVKGGIEYNPSSLVYLRVGGATYPTQASFGIGVNYQGLKIDISSMYHSILGLSPQIGLSYAFGKNYSKPTIQP